MSTKRAFNVKYKISVEVGKLIYKEGKINFKIYDVKGADRYIYYLTSQKVIPNLDNQQNLTYEMLFFKNNAEYKSGRLG